MKTATIAIDARMLGSSGIGTYIKFLLDEFVRLEHDFHFILIGDKQKIQKLVGKSDRFTIRSTDVPIFSISEQIHLPKLASGADLLHSPHHNVPFFWRGKLLVTFHDALHWDFPEYLPDWRAKFYLKMVSHRIAKADAVIVPSKFTAKRLAENIAVPQRKIHIVPQGVDRHFFSKKSIENTRTIFKKYNLVPGEFLLYVGNMKPHKNIERVVRAYSLAREKGLKIKLVLVGKSQGLKKTIDIEKISEYDGIEYIGEIPFLELPYFYSGARAFLFVSLYEGFGLPPLEAMSCGCPVLTSDSASLPEVVGESALIVNPEDVPAIADKILKISLDLKLRKSLIYKSLERIRLFEWEKTAVKTLEIYKMLLEE